MDMDYAGYTPIDCSLYSEYELAIMHRDRIQLCWRDPGGNVHIGIVTPTDLRTRNSAEFMIVTARDSETFAIRLDRILHFIRIQHAAAIHAPVPTDDNCSI